MTGSEALDVEFVRAQFPAFAQDINLDQSFFDNAGGSYACIDTIDALHRYYTETKVQPYSTHQPSRRAGDEMDRSRERWAEALGAATDEVVFGPSTSINTYVLANAFGQLLGPGDEVVVTNQDHEANTGVFRRMVERVGATLREWRTDPSTGLLDPDGLDDLLTERTRLVTVPHASNVVGQENDVARITAAAHRVGARVVVDGVSFAPHTFPDVAALDADVYLFSLYKTYSVHQGLMVVRNGLLAELPNQSHFFNDDVLDKRLNPAGPDHAQVAASGAVLDYVERTFRHHGGDDDAELRTVVADVSTRWRAHEDSLTAPLLDALARRDDIRLLGPPSLDTAPGHRCPTVAFSPLAVEPSVVAQRFVDLGVQTSADHFYAYRVLHGLDLDPDRGVVRLSFVHYTSAADIDRVLNALDDALAR